MQKTVAVNEAGLRIGEDHPNAKLTDTEVEHIRSLHEERMSYDVLAEKFEVRSFSASERRVVSTKQTLPLTMWSTS